MKKYIYTVFISCILLMRCDFFEQDVYVDIPEHKSRIVVNSIITPEDSLIRIALTRSVGMESDENVGTPLRDADIRLVCNGKRIEGLWYADSLGYYLADYQAAAGDYFELSVAAEGLEEVHSSLIVPETASISEAKRVGRRTDMDGYEYEAIQFKIEDLPNEDNYFEVYLIGEESYTWEDSVFTYYNEITYLESPLPWLTYSFRGLLFSDAAFKNTSINLEVWTDYFDYVPSQDNKYFVAVRHVTESYYEYMRIYDIHQWNQYPDLFSGEPVPMYSNIEDGFGVFAACSKSMTALEMD